MNGAAFMTPTEEKLIIGYRALAEFLTTEGYPTTKSTIAKYCSPALNIGPPVHALWGKKQAFVPSQAIAWAKGRLKSPDGRGKAKAAVAA
jgi:hypothetical protein